MFRLVSAIAPRHRHRHRLAFRCAPPSSSSSSSSSPPPPPRSCCSSTLLPHRHHHHHRDHDTEAEKVDDAAAAAAAAAKLLPWLFVGVGNPGLKFCGTRHNIGFELVDALSMAEGISFSTIRHNAYVGEGTVQGVPVVLAKPQTYANLIGESVAPLVEHYGLPTERIVVMFDDVDTRLTRLWLLARGGHGNHKGLINLIAHLNGNRNFPRLRIGIGSPPAKMDMKAYVLQKFRVEEKEMVNKTLVRGIEVLRHIATMGLDSAIDKMSRPKLSP